MTLLRDVCRECKRDLKKVAPRAVVTVLPSAKLPARTIHWYVTGNYCSADCALDAIVRGYPKRKIK